MKVERLKTILKFRTFLQWYESSRLFGKILHSWASLQSFLTSAPVKGKAPTNQVLLVLNVSIVHPKDRVDVCEDGH